MAGEGSDGAAYQQVAAARVEASNEDTSIRSESLLDFGLAARPGPNTRHMAPKALSLQTQQAGFPEKPNCTGSLKPEARTADSSAITLLIRLRVGCKQHSPLANAQQNATETGETLLMVGS